MPESLQAYLLKKLREKKAEVAETVVAGACGSYETYKEQTGRMTGLDEAVDIVRDGFRRYHEEADGDDNG